MLNILLALLAVANFVHGQENLIATYAGTIASGCNRGLGTALNAGMPTVADVFFASDGTGYYASTNCKAVLKHDRSTQIVSVFAGTSSGSSNSGDGGAATSAHVIAPQRVATDPSNENLYICGPYYIRIVNLATNTINLWAGTYSASSDDDSTSGIGTGDGGPATSATLGQCGGLYVNATGFVFVADLYSRIRVISPGESGAAGIITTFAGTTTQDYSEGFRTEALFWNPGSIWADESDMYVADTELCRIRKIDLATGMTSNFAGSGWCSSTDNEAKATSATINSGLFVCGKDTVGK